MAKKAPKAAAPKPSEAQTINPTDEQLEATKLAVQDDPNFEPVTLEDGTTGYVAKEEFDDPHAETSGDTPILPPLRARALKISTNKVKSFRRCGRTFGKLPTIIREGELSAEEVERLTSEPKLRVEFIEQDI